MRATKWYAGTGDRGGILTHGRVRTNAVYRAVSRFRTQKATGRGAGGVGALSSRAPSLPGLIAGAFGVLVAWIVTIASAVTRDKADDAALGRRLIAAMCACVVVGATACAVVPAFLNAGRVTVSLDIDGNAVSIDTFDGTVGEVLARYDIALGAGDVLYPSASTPLEEDMAIRLRRAISVYVETDGQRRKVNLLSGTVDDALRAAGVEYADADVLSYAKHSKLSPGMVIALTRVDTEHEFETQVMPFRIKYVDDDTILKGEEKITQRGIEGKKEIQYRLTYKDGVLVSREAVGERVIQAPRSRIVSVGTKVAPKKTAAPKATTASAKATTPPKASSSASTIKVNGKNYEYKEMLRMEVTAYTHTGRTTATGTWPKVGTVAVDKSVIPMGTKLYVRGYGFAQAEDVGVRGNQIDVFLDTYDECIKWGRKRNVKVYILK